MKYMDGKETNKTHQQKHDKNTLKHQSSYQGETGQQVRANRTYCMSQGSMQGLMDNVVQEPIRQKNRAI